MLVRPTVTQTKTEECRSFEMPRVCHEKRPHRHWRGACCWLPCAWAWSSADGAVPAAAEEPALREGSPAPILTFKDCRGAAHAIDWSTGTPKAAVLFFFDPQSPPCLMEMTFLDTLLARARDFGLAVYAIESRGRAPADINQSLERYCALYRDPSFAMVPDPYFRLGALFRIRQTPTTFLVDGSGAIVLLREGFEQATAVELTRNVERILKQGAGSFSFALRSLGVSEQDETALLARLAAHDEENDRVVPKALMVGDLVPALEFVDLIGRSSRWEWPAPGAPARVVVFWGGLVDPRRRSTGLSRENLPHGSRRRSGNSGGGDRRARCRTRPGTHGSLPQVPLAPLLSHRGGPGCAPRHAFRGGRSNAPDVSGRCGWGDRATPPPDFPKTRRRPWREK